MGDLIWIGNTLYPRGLVLTVAALVFITPFVIGAIVSLIRNSAPAKRQ